MLLYYFGTDIGTSTENESVDRKAEACDSTF